MDVPKNESVGFLLVGNEIKGSCPKKKEFLLAFSAQKKVWPSVFFWGGALENLRIHQLTLDYSFFWTGSCTCRGNLPIDWFFSTSQMASAIPFPPIIVKILDRDERT